MISMSLPSFFSSIKLFNIRKPRFPCSAQPEVLLSTRAWQMYIGSFLLHLATTIIDVLITVILVIGLITAIITLSHFHPMLLSLCWHAMCCKGRICARLHVCVLPRYDSLPFQTHLKATNMTRITISFSLNCHIYLILPCAEAHFMWEKKNKWQRMEQKKNKQVELNKSEKTIRYQRRVFCSLQLWVTPNVRICACLCVEAFSPLKCVVLLCCAWLQAGLTNASNEKLPPIDWRSRWSFSSPSPAVKNC